MSEETFQPKRRKITEGDVDARTAQENAAELEAMARMRAMAAQDGGREVDEPTFDRPQGLPGMAEPAPVMNIKGNVPPALREAMARKGMDPSDGPKKQSRMDPNRQREERPVQNQQFSQQHGESALFQQLVQGVKQDGYQYEEITLPSGGKFYDGTDGPRDGVLTIRPMTGEEEMILATPRFVKKGQAINMIFSKCMQNKYRPEDFLAVDRTFLLIYLRGISYSPEYDVELKCPDCDKKFGHTIHLNHLDVTPCPDDFGPALEGTLPASGYTFRYRIARGRDEQQLQDYRDRRVKAFGEGADDTLSHRTVMLIEDIEGLTDKDELKKLLKVLKIEDVAYMRSVISEPPFGVDTTVQITCSNCLHEFDIDLPLEANFFFPKARKKDKS